MSRRLTALLAALTSEDRLRLVQLCDSYSQSVLGRNAIMRSMWAHPNAWDAERRANINAPSAEMVSMQEAISAEFIRILGWAEEDERKLVFDFLLGRFDV